MLAILGFSRWPLVRVLPAFHLDSTKTRTPTIRIHAEAVSVTWVDGATSSAAAARLTHMGRGVRMASRESCAMARVVLASKYAVLYRNDCVQGVRFKTRRCVLPMFAPHNTAMTFSRLSSDLVSESLGGYHHGQCLTKCSGGQKSVSALGEQNGRLAESPVFVPTEKASFPLAPRH